MQHILFGSDSSLVSIAILIKTTAFAKSTIQRAYVTPSTIPSEKFIAFDLAYTLNNKCPAKLAKEHLEDLLPEISILNVTTLLVCDPIYFKILTKLKKVNDCYGHIYECAIKDYEYLDIILAPNYQSVLYNPAIQSKIDTANETLIDHVGNTYVVPGTNVIHSAYYPETISAIKAALHDLQQYPALTCDIEATSLKFYKAKIETIAFAWDKHNFIAFCVGRDNTTNTQIQIQTMLRKFFTLYKGTTIWHNANYDHKVLIYNLWMQHLADYKNMIKGIKIMTKNFEDTKLIAYLATNNAIQNKLSLKELSSPFMGNYGVL